MQSPSDESAQSLDRLFALETFGIKLGLENIARLCEALDHPERCFTSIHVAGTNGKGSVTAMVHAAFVSSGLRAARYTSPHLTRLAERFVIGTDPVDRVTLETAAGVVLDHADRLRASGPRAIHPTFFEATTAIAFELFRRASVDVATIEVGLGGRFDATNVIAAPVGAITSIGFDHQQQLGSTLEAIAFEKAGIIKPGMTIVTGALPVTAASTIASVAADRGARVLAAGDGLRLDGAMVDGRGVLTVETPIDRYGPFTLALRGAHQIGNALVAIRVLEAAREAGIPVSRQAIEAGLSSVEWPARLEVIDAGPSRILLDSAHNVDGAVALAAHLARWHPVAPPLVIGVMRDKDVDGILAALLPVTSRVIATQAATPRAVPADDLSARITVLDPTRHVRVIPDAATAVLEACVGEPLVCVAGSVVLAGEVREALRRRAILP